MVNLYICNMDLDKIKAEETKLIRVTKKAAGYAAYNKLGTGVSVADFASAAIVEKWERENVGKKLVFIGDRVIGSIDMGE